MNKNLKKSLLVLISATALVGTTFSSFASNVDTTNQVKKERPEKQKNQNTIIGKITAIDQTNVTIEVATLKAKEKPVDFNKENMQTNNNEDATKREKPNMDEMFTPTGETKTINIATAEFGNKKDDNENAVADDTTNGVKKNLVKKTYADYKVGDYISIQATDDTYQVAKRVNQAMFGRMRGFKKDGKNRNTSNVNNAE